MINDSSERYGSISRVLHWIMAVLIGWQLFKFGDRIAEGEHWVGQTLVPWHISIGTLLLVLVVLRLAWVMAQRNQRPSQAQATAKLVKAGHGLLYAGMLLMPISGVMVMLGEGYGLNPFGFEVFAEGNKIAWMASLGEFHSSLAWILAVLIVGHIGMAFVHHFVRRDDTLKRML